MKANEIALSKRDSILRKLSIMLKKFHEAVAANDRQRIVLSRRAINNLCRIITEMNSRAGGK